MARASYLVLIAAMLYTDASASWAYSAEPCRVAAAEKRAARRGLARRRARANLATPTMAPAENADQAKGIEHTSTTILNATDNAPGLMSESDSEVLSPAAALFPAP
jgi:hypothetical protein